MTEFISILQKDNELCLLERDESGYKITVNKYVSIGNINTRSTIYKFIDPRLFHHLKVEIIGYKFYNFLVNDEAVDDLKLEKIGDYYIFICQGELVHYQRCNEPMYPMYDIDNVLPNCRQIFMFPKVNKDDLKHDLLDMFKHDGNDILEELDASIKDVSDSKEKNELMDE